MVKGLDVFQEHFADHADRFILIGGTAATLAMEQAGLEFRATKDLDIVLHVEALNPAFGTTFWQFIQNGGYVVREASETERPVLYRFQKPTNPRYPFMLELFCRSPHGIQLPEGNRLTPIPFDDAVSSLSAILLNEVYYDFILAGRRQGGAPADRPRHSVHHASVRGGSVRGARRAGHYPVSTRLGCGNQS